MIDLDKIKVGDRVEIIKGPFSKVKPSQDGGHGHINCIDKIYDERSKGFIISKIEVKLDGQILAERPSSVHPSQDGCLIWDIYAVGLGELARHIESFKNYTKIIKPKPELLKPGRWYVVVKPEDTEGKSINWTSSMDKHDGGIYQCKEVVRTFGAHGWRSYAKMVGSDEYLFDEEWVLGPFSTRFDAVKEQKRYLNHKETKETLSKNKKTCTVSKSNSSIYAKITSRWDKPVRNSAPQITISGNSVATTSPTLSVNANTIASAKSISIKPKNTGAINLALANSTTHTEVKDKQDKLIDDVFNEYHDRISHREKLDARLEKEFCSTKPKSNISKYVASAILGAIVATAILELDLINIIF